MGTVHINHDEASFWINKDDGIRANEEFLKDELLRQQNTIKTVVITIFREFAYVIKALFKNFIFSSFFASTKYSNLATEKTNKQALVVFFHGLDGQPADWNNQISQFEKQSKEHPQLGVEIFAPKVPKKGHSKLDDSELNDIYKEIAGWANNNPGKPIVVFGQSNGSRISLYLETLLRKAAPKNPMHLSLTGGVLYGTSLIQNLTKKISAKVLERMSFGLMTSVACEELALASNSSKNLLENVRKPLEEGVAKRSYRKYAALHDFLVKETGSSLPVLVTENQTNKREKDYIVIGYGHNTLMDFVADDQVRKCYRWINKNTSRN